MNNCLECPLFLLFRSLLSEKHEDFYDPNIERIKKIVAIQTGVSVKELESKSRQQHIVRARNIAMKKCRQIGISLRKIGIAFNRKHSTVIHSIN